MFYSNLLHNHFMYEVWMTMMENCGHWVSVMWCGGKYSPVLAPDGCSSCPLPWWCQCVQRGTTLTLTSLLCCVASARVLTVTNWTIRP